MEYLTNVRYHKNMIPTCYQVSAMQRYSESLAKSTAYAPDANLAAADNTSSYYAFERKFLGVVMNSQPGMMYWNGGDGGGKGSPDGGMNAGHVNYALGATSGILAGKYALGGVTDLLNTMQASSDAMKWGFDFSKEINLTANIGTGLKWFGRASGAFSVGYSYYQYSNGQISEGKFALDATITGASFLPGVGPLIGAQYFIIDNTIGVENFGNIMINQGIQKSNMIFYPLVGQSIR